MVVADHLATLAVGLQQLQEAQARAERRWERTEEGSRSLLVIAEIREREIGETNGRLNALLSTVGRHISGRRGGGSDE